ncbi:UNVERIFIED_CONTAM: hypothetical protein Sradi_3195600 [Sesamum radiatum]|uniref:Uncharacterized protein n=1 Tax=Sesamum radiatum TaxID=300843 RepID=A0AAW2RHJ9_SESRA
MIVKNRSFKFVDSGDAKELEHNYFVAIRLSYLTLRQGNKFIIEPYNPHRFGRQFGYFQDVSGTLKYDTRAASLEERHRYWRLCFYQSLRQKLGFLVCLLMLRNSARRLIKHGGLSTNNQVDGGENNPSPMHVPPIVVKYNSQAVLVEKGKLEDKVQSIDANEESETSHSTTTPPLGMGKGKQLPHPPAVSVFDVFQKFDVTKVEESLNTFFVKVRAYDEARSLSSQKLSRSFHEQHLKEAKDRLQDVQAKVSEGASKVQSIMDESEHIEKEIVALKGQRTSLCTTLKRQKQLNHNVQAKVHEVEEDIAALENTASLDDGMVEDLEPLKANIEDLKEDLKSLNPFA